MNRWFRTNLTKIKIWYSWKSTLNCKPIKIYIACNLVALRGHCARVNSIDAEKFDYYKYFTSRECEWVFIILSNIVLHREEWKEIHQIRITKWKHIRNSAIKNCGAQVLEKTPTIPQKNSCERNLQSCRNIFNK